MNRFPPPPSGPDDGGDDRLLRRYHEANALDDARPGPALREAVLAHARSVAAAQNDGAPTHAHAPASNDPSWTLRALGSLAVLGLVGLLTLQFDRGSPEEREAAFGDAPAPAVTRPAPAAAPDRQPAGEPEDRSGPAAVPSLKTDRPPPPTPAAPAAGPAPLPANTARGSLNAPDAAPSAERTAPDAQAQAAPEASEAEPATTAEAREPTRNAGALRREAPAADRARSSPDLPPLLAASGQGDSDAVRRLLAEGTDVNTRDAVDRTALMLAARRGDAALVRLLLQAGADPALRDHQGLNAAEHAARAGHSELLPAPGQQPPERP